MVNLKNNLPRFFIRLVDNLLLSCTLLSLILISYVITTKNALANTELPNSPSTSITLSASQHTLTPGQLVTLSLDINYADGDEIIFKYADINWQAFELLAVEKLPVSWKKSQGENSHWHQRYQIELAAPIVGKYQLPVLSVYAIHNGQTSQLQSEQLNLEVVSSFSAEQSKAPQLQDIIRGAPPLAKQQKFSAWHIALLAVLAIFLNILAYWFYQKKQSSNKSNTQQSEHQNKQQSKHQANREIS